MITRWQNLRYNKCPKCNGGLKFNDNEEMLYCSVLVCGFQISQYRFERLLGQMNEKVMRGERIPDNFSELQRMGTEKPTQQEADEAMLDRIGI